MTQGPFGVIPRPFASDTPTVVLEFHGEPRAAKRDSPFDERIANEVSDLVEVNNSIIRRPIIGPEKYSEEGTVVELDLGQDSIDKDTLINVESRADQVAARDKSGIQLAGVRVE